ncbi:magnesium transporter CorA family protein [Gemmobacter fulvus]|uniref:Magnesium transport protein CorA n=1 Tax=Gemmobacter fulvus TaxID=2840474 RepID=A0A975P8D2_9RHOB|nr:magnesium transporter CorA family protein [Gemmobacter fulvus]QWK91247.1 magnesium transporter CorA family protein [Gemmobacter fulvus]
MQFAYIPRAGRLERILPPVMLTEALWIDLYRPLPTQVADVAALGLTVPTLADMEEIEISNRLYREAGVDYMTVVLPGLSQSKEPQSGPVTFILSPERLVTVRHHAPRPFETYPERADKSGPGCDRPERVFLGLIEEIIGRLADLLEGVGRGLDQVAGSVYRRAHGPARPDVLQMALEQAGQEGELLGRVRLALLTVERAVSFFGQTLAEREGGGALRPVVKGLMRDIQALEVHADFLAARVALASDATLGMINLAQNATVRIVSVVAALFLPPTLIASIYGMNFVHMPELALSFGYPLALGLMLLSALGTYLFFKWKRWL